MGVLEIIVIIVGLTAFVGSFFLSENNKGVEITIPDEVIHELIDKEISRAVETIEEQTKQKVSGIQESTKRSMEKLSNEKIMAIDEFSNTVLDKIYKNHEEAVFLYDMLNNKHVQLKNSITELDSMLKDKKKETGVNLKTEISANSWKENEAVEIGKSKLLLDEISVAIGNKVENREKENEYANNLSPEDNLEENTFLQEEKTGEEKNKILEYHKMGKTEIEIAKLLDIGVGEVKLIIGLYEANK